MHIWRDILSRITGMRFVLLFVGVMAWGQTPPQPPALPTLYSSVTVTAKPEEGQRLSEVLSRTLFSRDDQLLHVLDAGINAAAANRSRSAGSASIWITEA